MNVSDAIRTRKSVRRFLDKPVEKEKLLEVLEAGRLAPSASNRQEWRYVVVTDKGMREKLAEAASNQSFVGQAPVVIVCLAESDQHRMTCGELCYPIDCAISMDHMTLRATETRPRHLLDRRGFSAQGQRASGYTGGHGAH